MISTRFVVGGDGTSASAGPGGTHKISEVPDDLVRAAISGDRDGSRHGCSRRSAHWWSGTAGVDSDPRTAQSLSADDVAQEVCLAVLTALPTYRPQGRPFLAFVYRVTATSSSTRIAPRAALGPSPSRRCPTPSRPLPGPNSRRYRASSRHSSTPCSRSCRTSSGGSSSFAWSWACPRRRPGRSWARRQARCRLAQHRASTRMREIAVPRARAGRLLTVDSRRNNPHG